MAPLISWIASETARGPANYDDADVIALAILLLIILTVLGLKEALLDIVAAIWSRFGHPDGRIRPALARLTCPRCGSRLLPGKEVCDVCAELGIPDMPPALAWTPPAVDGGLPVEFVGSATWARPDQGRDIPAEVARLRTSVALGGGRRLREDEVS